MVTFSLTSLAVLALTASEADWQQSGRPLPRPEAQRASVDPRLVPYAACRRNLSGRVSGSVTTILPDLFARWNRRFAAIQPQTTIAASPPFGPPQGKLSEQLRAFLDGKSGFALVSRELTGEDVAAYRRAYRAEPLVVPVAAGSWRHFGFVDTVVVIVNHANPLSEISFAQIDAIFAAERRRGSPALQDWGELGVARWRGRAIRPVGGAGWLSEDSARSAVVRQRVLLGGPWREELGIAGDEASGPESVARDAQAIAITGLGHLPSGTRALAVSAGPGAPYVAPGYRAVAAGDYPLSRTIDMIVPRRADGRIDPVLAEFLRYVLSREGQMVVAEQGIFLPLTAEQARRSLALLGPCPG